MRVKYRCLLFSLEKLRLLLVGEGFIVMWRENNRKGGWK